MKLSKIGQRKVVTITKETSLEDAARMMREHHVGNVVVVEGRNGRRFPQGILTDRDIVMATIALGAPASAFTAEEVMTSSLYTVAENESLESVIDLMKTKGVKRVPILGREEELVGIISLEDVMALLSTEISALAEVAKRQKEVEIDRRRKLA